MVSRLLLLVARRVDHECHELLQCQQQRQREHERQQRDEREWRVSPIPIIKVTMYKGENLKIMRRRVQPSGVTPGKFMATLIEASYTTLVSLYDRADASCMAAVRLSTVVSFPIH